MKTYQTIIAVILVAGFTALGLNDITSNHHKLKLQSIELQSANIELKDLQLKYDILNQDLSKELHSKTKSQKRIKELEIEKKKLEEERTRLRQEVSVKKQRQEIASRNLQNAADVTPKAYAASSTGSCDEWLTGAGVQEVYAARELIRRESNCNPQAVNQSSGACGVAQELPCGKSGCTWGDGACQVRWMDSYVKERYGSWGSAVGFHDRNNYY